VNEPYTNLIYAGTGSTMCSGNFNGEKLYDLIIWRGQLLVISTAGVLYLVNDPIWKSPVPPSIPVPSPSPIQVKVPAPVPVLVTAPDQVLIPSPDQVLIPSPDQVPVPSPNQVPIPETMVPVPNPVPNVTPESVLPAPADLSPEPGLPEGGFETPSEVNCVNYTSGVIIHYEDKIILCDNATIPSETSVTYWNNTRVRELANVNIINVYTNMSYVSIEGNLALDGILSTEGDSSFQIRGNFSISSLSHLIIMDNSIFSVIGCMNFNGTLTIKQNLSNIEDGQNQTLSEYTCYTGNFKEVKLETIGDIAPCRIVTPQLVYQSQSVAVFYNVVDNCNQIKKEELEGYKLVLILLIPTVLLIVVILAVGNYYLRKYELKVMWDHIP